MIRELTKSEREAIASAMFEVANERIKKADAILRGAAFLQHDGMEPDEAASQKTERLAGTVVARYKSLRQSGQAYGNLGTFILNNPVSVECLITIPEQL